MERRALQQGQIHAIAFSSTAEVRFLLSLPSPNMSSNKDHLTPKTVGQRGAGKLQASGPPLSPEGCGAIQTPSQKGTAAIFAVHDPILQRGVDPQLQGRPSASKGFPSRQPGPQSENT